MGKPGWVAKKTWNELSPRSRRLIVTGGAFEGVLKIAALVDLARRPADQVRGSKVLWGAVVVLVNAVGAAPIAYFVQGRRRAEPLTGHQGETARSVRSQQPLQA